MISHFVKRVMLNGIIEKGFIVELEYFAIYIEDVLNN